MQLVLTRRSEHFLEIYFITSTPPRHTTGRSSGIVSPLSEFMLIILSLSSKSTVYIASKILGRCGYGQIKLSFKM